MLLLIVGTAIAGAVAGLAWRERAAWTRASGGDRRGALVAVPALILLFAVAVPSIAVMLGDRWSFVRLAPSAAMARGHRLYNPEGEGALLGWSYGPLVPLLQIPVTALGHPVSALIGAGILNELMLLVPLLLLLCRALPGVPLKLPKALVILAAVQALLMQFRPSLYWIQSIQVDSFAMGFVGLGIAVLLGGDPERPLGRGRIWATALLFGAAGFCKQNEFVLLGLPVLYVGWKEGRRAMIHMTLACAAVVGLGILLCLAAFGWKALYLNAWVVPARHPWALPLGKGLGQTALLFLEETQGLLLIFILGVGLDGRLGGPAARSRDWLKSRPWILPAAAALLIWPVSLLGRLKMGGDVNSFHSVYFLAAALGMIAARGLASGGGPAVLRWGIPCALLGVALGGAWSIRGESRSLEDQFRDSLLEREFQFSRAHPEEVYFAADPLVTLYTDRKLYHQGYGVFDRILAGQPPSEKQLFEHLPARMSWVGTPGPPWWAPEPLTPVLTPPGLKGVGWYLWVKPSR